jgi:hypothetical protein
MPETERQNSRPGIEHTDSYKNATEAARLASDNLHKLSQSLWNLAYNGRGKPAIKAYLNLSDRMQEIGGELERIHHQFLNHEML